MSATFAHVTDVSALAEAIAGRCQHPHQHGARWDACCPAHDDTTPSLSIAPGTKTGSVVLKCHSGCTQQAVVAALGLTMADLFVPPPPNGHKRLVKVYDYYDAHGTLVHQTLRYVPKQFVQRRPDPVTPGDYVWNLDGIEPVLYHLPEVLAAIQRGETIYLTEGEKDADRLQVHGLTATCNPMGACAYDKDGSQKKWRTSYTETLRGATVVLLPDNDVAGRKHTDVLTHCLHRAVAALTVVRLPGLSDKGDVSDWLDQGHTRAKLEALVQQTAPWTPDDTPTEPPTPALLTRCAADVTPEQVQWLWKPYIALGTLCMLDGDPGIGKSLLMLQLAANISRGHPFPDQTGKPTVNATAPHNVLIMTREDSLAKTIRPRLDASGADPRRVYVSAHWLDTEGKEQAFTLKHLPLLAAELARLHPRLVVLDPIQSFFGDIDMHRANQTRPLLDALAALAEQHQCAIVCIRHPAKPGEGIGKALHRGLGSIDIIGAARTGLFIEQYPGDDTRALLAQTKSNLGAKGRTQIFSKKEGVFAWERVTRLTDDDLAGSGRGPHHRAFLEGLLWLEQRLDGGFTWNASDIETEAEAQDISITVLKRAKKALGIVSAQPKGEAHPGWTWRLPPLSLPLESSSDSTEVTDTSDTTDTSDLKSTTYADHVVRGSVVSGEAEGSEVSEDQVVTDPPTTENGATVSDGVFHVGAPCYLCHGTLFWTNTGAQPVCQRCHPRPASKKEMD